MGDAIVLDQIGLKADGPTLSLSLPKGSSLAVCGPGGSGKSRFLRILAGQERPGHGVVKLLGDARFPESLPKRTRVGSYLRQYPEFEELLTLTGLWEHRQAWLSDLPPSLCTLLEVLPCFRAEQGAVFLDGYLDRLDPWTLPTIMNHLRRLRKRGVALVVATHRPDVVEEGSMVVVLRREEVRFAGTVEELRTLHQPHEIIVESHHQPGVRAIVDPFVVDVEETTEGTVYRTREGQELAAKLLVQGYGDIRQVVLRRPTIEDALRSIR